MPLSARINLSRAPLESSGAEVLAYATNDSGDMTGGLPQTLLLECGEELRQALRAGLAECARDLGDIVWTPAFKLAGTRFVSHIIGTRSGHRGDHCEEPGRLEAGVYQTLSLAEQTGARLVAFANLSTGADRASAEHMARLMIGPMRRYFRDCRDSQVRVMLCLPHWDDFKAFQDQLARSL